ncbi:MAG: hypothetical protein AAF364_18970 [Pseudomonadota bacterium]
MNAYSQLNSSFSGVDYENGPIRFKRSVAEANKKMAEAQFISDAIKDCHPAAISPLIILKARTVGQEAFFKSLKVNCRPLNPAESVRHKGKSYILSGEERINEVKEKLAIVVAEAAGIKVYL